MKTRLFTRALLLVTALFTGVSLFADGSGNKTKYTSPVYVTLNAGVLQSGQPVHLTVQIENPKNVAFIALPLEGKDNEGFGTEVKTSKAKDGKVDVDIIIRGGEINPDILPLPTNQDVKIKIFEIEYITVDNISGVYGSQDIPPTGVTAAKVTGVDYTDEAGTPSTLSQESPIEIAPLFRVATIKKFTDVNVYPNPSRDGNLNLSLSDDITVSLITVHNAVGALVYQVRPVPASQQINLSLDNLNSGVYFIRLETASGEIVKKFNIAR